MELPGNIPLLCEAVVYIFVSRQLGIDFTHSLFPGRVLCAYVAGEAGGRRQGVRTRHDAEGAGDRVPSIGSHATALDAILVTHNTGEFSRIKGLKIEDWIAH